jgi:mannose-6-phosphate isomerase-like protein (cupin superfamily)
MTKKIYVLLGFVALFFANVAFAQGAAVVANLQGTAQVQTGNATPRALRLGDQVQQGDTISTGANSNVALKFDDGEVTALTQNSRMTITAYQYEAASRTGNMLLSLVRGGMRAVTGLLGANHPDRVAYRAATATIGIRGTDVDIATDGSDVIVTVNSGEITVLVGAQSVTLHRGDSAYIHQGTITLGLPSQASTVLNLLRDVEAPAIANAINSALALAGAPGASSGAVSNSGTPGAGGAGGGSVSVH